MRCSGHWSKDSPVAPGEDHGEPMLEHSAPEALHPVEGTHTGQGLL